MTGWTERLSEVFIVQNNKGSISILFVIITLIGSILCATFLEFFMYKQLRREIIGIIDISAASALKDGILDNSQRRDQYANDIDKIKSTFINLTTLSFNKIQAIKGHQIVINNIQNKFGNWGIGLDIDNKYYTVIDVTVSVKMSARVMDNIIKSSAEYYDTESGAIYEIRSNGAQDDGLTEMVVRYKKRLVYNTFSK